MAFGNYTICSPDRDRNSAIELTCLRTIANTDDVQRLWPLSISRFSIVLQCVTTHLPECLIASKVPSGAGIDNETGTAVWQLGSSVIGNLVGTGCGTIGGNQSSTIASRHNIPIIPRVAMEVGHIQVRTVLPRGDIMGGSTEYGTGKHSPFDIAELAEETSRRFGRFGQIRGSLTSSIVRPCSSLRAWLWSEIHRNRTAYLAVQHVDCT